MSTTSAHFPLPTNEFTDAGEGPVDSGTEAGAAGDSSKNSINLSTGGMIAIIIVVVVVVIVGVSTATLFFIAKKREWKVREKLRRSARKVAAALTPRRSQFPDSVKRSVEAPKSSRLQTSDSRDEKGYPKRDKGKKSQE
ncbi:hypothetical protein ISF_02458 [Cordyceps fumosorosea ARSEF 2679]|uniref:Transmembrane protein n=1 Tax=Cordyceps fumosorosea (strain ARSEF 2679) TaxID=1081104 RepID=A0A162LH18_CORFA|nr:hypothetical protein ISF_02458 [Cordyceps fumosorosea ARSEF 2679]OAA70484.1 hypothetical protein ISF_02458 [Cordyceps fumosorosea ARSEF 2679]